MEKPGMSIEKKLGYVIDLLYGEGFMPQKVTIESIGIMDEVTIVSHISKLEWKDHAE